MKATKENIPNPKEIEKEISEFLSKKFGGAIKVLSPTAEPEVLESDDGNTVAEGSPPIDFHLKPEELIAHLDQFVIRQDAAKAVLATKICTHFNRIQQAHNTPHRRGRLIGSIKNNVLMIGPTGVGKTYMIKLIAEKIGVPFVKGDATKFSETGYVGGDVEDLVRDLVREADDDLTRAQYGIVYIDEIDKIASSRNLVGADVSRTGVQRALLKPMEETDVDLKVPHDPVSMLQEIERYRRSGGRDERRLNTKHILFIMSGAFTGLEEIIERRLNETPMGFGATYTQRRERHQLLNRVASEDLIAYGFESEFIGRLPVRAVFDPLGVDDLHAILRNPNNPIVLGKKLDFAAYGIDIHFSDAALRRLAEAAATENTGARGLVGAVERALIEFERRLPSTNATALAVTPEAMADPAGCLKRLSDEELIQPAAVLKQTVTEERETVTAYLTENEAMLSMRHAMAMTPDRIRMAARIYSRYPTEIEEIIEGLKSAHDAIKRIELDFYQRHDINIVIEPDAVDSLLESWDGGTFNETALSRRLTDHFELGLKLVRDKTGQQRFFLTREALASPETFISRLITRRTPEDSDRPAVDSDTGDPPATPPKITGA